MATPKITLDSTGDFHSNGKMTQNFGIAIKGSSLAPFVPMGAEYPSAGSYTFSTQEDFQDQITIAFHKSSKNIATHESLLGSIRIHGFKLEKAEIPVIRVHYEIDNDTIQVWATNERNDAEIQLDLIRNS